MIYEKNKTITKETLSDTKLEALSDTNGKPFRGENSTKTEKFLFCNRKAELTMAQIIGLIMAILGFVIVLILLFSLDLEGFNKDEICRLSVNARATAPERFNRALPLKCETEKICLGSDCDDKFLAEKNVRDVKMSGNSEERAEIIEKLIADEMFDCWDIMGQGKLDLFGGVENPEDAYGQIGYSTKFTNTKATCVICSRIALGKDVDEGKIGEVDVNDYMRNKEYKIGTGVSYIEKMTDGRVSSYPAEFRSELSQDKAKGTNEVAVVFMQILTKEDPITVLTKVGITTGAFVLGTGTTLAGPKALLSKELWILGAIAGLAAGTNGAINQARDRAVSAGYCGKFTSAAGTPDKARQGCSLIVPVDYNNIKEVNQLCKTIEGEL